MSSPVMVRFHVLTIAGAVAAALVTILAGSALGQAAAGVADEVEGPPKPRPIELVTTDGVSITAWYYAPAAEGGKAAAPLATVMLVHDLNGSHDSVEPLALKLQQSGLAVVSPDLRGHGESRMRADGEELSPERLRKPDLEMIAAVSGGTVRDQAAVRGDLEAVRGWIKSQPDLDVHRICLVGSGLGGTLAALWAANDRAWGDRPLASGSQGNEVRGIVLVSPVFAAKGVSITPAIAPSGIRENLPILLLGGTADRDAIKLFEQLKRHRPDSWFEQKAGQEPRTAADIKDKPTGASLFFMQTSSTSSADAMLADRLQSPADRIVGFITLAMNRPKR